MRIFQFSTRGIRLDLMGKIAFLDRDGTFIWEPEKPEGVDPRETFPLKSAEEVQFMEGAIDGKKALVAKGYVLVMATNQTFLGTPKHPKEVFDEVMEKIEGELKKDWRARLAKFVVLLFREYRQKVPDGSYTIALE